MWLLQLTGLAPLCERHRQLWAQPGAICLISVRAGFRVLLTQHEGVPTPSAVVSVEVTPEGAPFVEECLLGLRAQGGADHPSLGDYTDAMFGDVDVA